MTPRPAPLVLPHPKPATTAGGGPPCSAQPHAPHRLRAPTSRRRWLKGLGQMMGPLGGGASKGQAWPCHCAPAAPPPRLRTAFISSSVPFVCDGPLTVPLAHCTAPHPPGAWAGGVGVLVLGGAQGGGIGPHSRAAQNGGGGVSVQGCTAGSRCRARVLPHTPCSTLGHTALGACLLLLAPAEQKMVAALEQKPCNSHRPRSIWARGPLQLREGGGLGIGEGGAGGGGGGFKPV